MYQRRYWEEVRTRLQARWDEVPFWTEPEARIAFNEGLRLWNLLTGRWKRTITLPTVATVHEYTLPDTIVYRMRVAYNGRPLSPSAMQDLNLGRYDWRTETIITGGSVPTRPVLWVPFDLQTIRIWPADLGGGTLTVDGISDTPILVYDADFVDLGEETFSILLGYALHAAAFKLGGVFFAATLPYYHAFLRAAGEENSQIKTSQTYRRVLGLEHRDLKPLRGVPTQLDQLGRAG